MPLARALPFAVLAVAAVVVTVGTVALATPAPVDPAARDGGVVHWSDAVTPTASARTLTVSADVGSISATSGCGMLRGVPTVRESPSRVLLTVDVVEHPAPVGVACNLGLQTAIGVAVHLHAPIGARALIDGSTGDRHVALDASAGPTLRPCPPASRCGGCSGTSRETSPSGGGGTRTTSRST